MKEYSKNGGVISHAAMKAQMTHKTASRYLKAQAGPAAQRQARQPRTYRTREDPMVDGFVAALARYCRGIENSTDESYVWINFLRRMTYVLEACDDEPGES